MIRPTAIFTVVLALLSSSAIAQYIEISFTATIEDHGRYRHVEASAIFDTDAPPLLKDGNLVFEAIAGRVVAGPSDPMPFKAIEDEPDDTPIHGPQLIYSVAQGDFYLHITGSTGPAVLEVHPAGEAFTADMMSLPDEADAYAPGGDYTSQLISSGQFGRGVAHWDPSESPTFDNGSVYYTARVLKELPPEMCSPADINGDGVVNFIDISAFLQAWHAGCP
ncbi:MAG: hypothetical protein WD114_06240 [Phycisphaerales bacterium]